MVKRFSGVARPWADRSLRQFQKLHQQYQCLATYAVGPAAEMGATTKIDVNPVPTSADERAIQLLRYTFRRGGPGAFMISLAILSFLAGAALGLWFRVPVLVLAIMLSLITVVGAGAAIEINPWWIALEALVVTVCLQLGYIPGIIIATYLPSREYQTRQRVAHDTISDFWPP